MIQYKQDPNAAKRMTLRLKDFEARSMLHTTAHEIPRAKFPVIDVHSHVNDASANHGEQVRPAEVIRAMDQVTVEQVMILTGMWGDKLQYVIDKMVKPYPSRFLVFTQLDWNRVDDPNFRQEMIEQLDDAVRRGERGLKVLKNLGGIAKHPLTTFLALHVANWPENLDAVYSWLDQYPNMYVDFAAREAELGRQPRAPANSSWTMRIASCLEQTANPTQRCMRTTFDGWRRAMNISYWGYPEQGRWEIYGPELPDQVPEKGYNKNAERIFSQFKGNIQLEGKKP